MSFHPHSTTPVGLIVLIIIFILFIALIVVFSQTVITNLTNIDSQANMIALIVAIIIPLILLGIIIYQIVRLIRERTNKKPGSRLKTRLLLFFVFIAVLSSIPQSLVSINFISSTINFWLEAKIEDALRGGLGISLDYYHGMVDNLNHFNSNPLMSIMLRDMERNPDRMWENIRTTNIQIHFIQIFNEQGEEVVFRGNQQGRVNDSSILSTLSTLKGLSGNLPKEDRAGLSILRNGFIQYFSGKPYYIITGTILSEGFDEKARQLTESLQSFNQLNRYRRLFKIVLSIFYFFFSFPIFLLAILVSFLLTDEIIMPIVSLEEATRRVAEGDFSFRILTRSEDELSVLVNSFNRMVSELSHSRKKLVQAEKISAWQDIAQRLAHEIKNPLTPIKLSAQRILKKYQSNRKDFNLVLEPAIHAIIQEVDNLNQLLQEFRQFARLPGPRLEMTQIRSLVQEVTMVYQNLSGKVSIDSSRISEDITLNVDRNQMKQVFANLFKNSIMAMPEGGEIRVWADIVKKENKDYCRIWVKDTGIGIDEEINEFIFNPYFTTKKDGVGLGLAIVERVIFDHDGVIRFETQKGAGTTFIIDLPMGVKS